MSIPAMILEIDAIKLTLDIDQIKWFGLDFDIQEFLYELDNELDEAEKCARFLERMIEAKQEDMRSRSGEKKMEN